MRRLNPDKLTVRYGDKTLESGSVTPRRYTLTHSDSTGELTLAIGLDYDYRQISGLYTRFMRDEVLAEWRNEQGAYSLHVYCHVGGGLVFGTRSMRESIFLNEMPLVLESLRYGDRRLFESNPDLDKSPIVIHLQTSGQDYRTVSFGSLNEFV